MKTEIFSQIRALPLNYTQKVIGNVRCPCPCLIMVRRWRHFPSHSIFVRQNDVLGFLFLHLGPKHYQYHLAQGSESKILERFNFCFRNGSENKTPRKIAQLERFKSKQILDYES